MLNKENKFNSLVVLLLLSSCSSASLVGVDKTDQDSKINNKSENDRVQKPEYDGEAIVNPISSDDGLTGGHFDADTFEESKRLHHVHAYDDKNDTNQIVYLGNREEASGKLSLKKSRLFREGKIFTIKFENAEHSKGAKLKINDRYYSWGILPPSRVTYSINNDNADENLTELAVIYDLKSIENGQISCSNPGDVKANKKNRNEALVVKLETDDGLIWEGVTYWHDDDCKLSIKK